MCSRIQWDMYRIPINVAKAWVLKQAFAAFIGISTNCFKIDVFYCPKYMSGVIFNLSTLIFVSQYEMLQMYYVKDWIQMIAEFQLTFYASNKGI